MEELVYRKLELSDVPTFIKLREQQLQEEGAEPLTDIRGALFSYYQKHLNDGTFVAWIAVKDRRIIATSGMSFVEKPAYYSNPSGRIGIISSMYTLKPYRRKGVAKRLLQLVIEEAKDYGCGVVQITASDEGVPLYESLGFVKSNRFLQYNL